MGSPRVARDGAWKRAGEGYTTCRITGWSRLRVKAGMCCSRNKHMEGGGMICGAFVELHHDFLVV